MANYTTMILSVIAVCMLCVAAAAPAAQKRTASKEQVLLARLMVAIKELASEAEGLNAFVERATSDMDLSSVEKRQAWEMDYGWGGGRFGKRGSVDAQKRYDAYGIAGRFGRDVDHVDSDIH